MSMDVNAAVVAEVERAGRLLTPLVVYTAGWQHSTDPEQRRMFAAAHDLIGSLAAIRTGLGLVGREGTP